MTYLCISFLSDTSLAADDGGHGILHRGESAVGVQSQWKTKALLQLAEERRDSHVWGTSRLQQESNETKALSAFSSRSNIQPARDRRKLSCMRLKRHSLKTIRPKWVLSALNEICDNNCLRETPMTSVELKGYRKTPLDVTCIHTKSELIPPPQPSISHHVNLCCNSLCWVQPLSKADKLNVHHAISRTISSTLLYLSRTLFRLGAHAKWTAH